MSLRDDLLPLIDELRAIPAELGFRPYQVWARKTVRAGPMIGVGAGIVTETRLLVGGSDPKVRVVTSKDVANGTAEMQSIEFEIGPLTPKFPGGGVSLDTLNPEKDGNPTTIMFVIKGPGLPPEGLLCHRVGDKVDRVLRTIIRVRSTGRKRPT